MAVVVLKDLAVALKQIKTVNFFLRSLLVGKEILSDKEKIEMQTKSANRLIVPLVGRRENGIFVKEGSFSADSYIPSLIKSFRTIESDDLLSQQFGVDEYGNPAKLQNAKENLAQKLSELKEIGARTTNYLLNELVFIGVVPQEKGAVGISYGKINSEVLSGTDLWTDSLADIIGYLREKQLEILQDTGMVMDHLVLEPNVVGYFLGNKDIADSMKNTAGSQFTFAPDSMPEGGTYIGRIVELGLSVFSYQDWAEYESGAEKQLMPKGTILLCKKGSFRIHYAGLTHRAKPNTPATVVKAKELAFPEYGIKSDDVDELKYRSAPLPAPNDVQGWLVAKVI